MHPELNRLSHYLSGETIEGSGLWCGGSMTLAEGVEDMTVDGARTRKPIDGVDVRSILYFLIFPNTLVSLHPDYVMLHTLWPQRGRTAPRSSASGSSSPRRSRRRTSTRPTPSSSGTRSTARTGTSARSRSRGWSRRSFTPGRYTTQEDDVHEFDVMIAERYLEALR